MNTAFNQVVAIGLDAAAPEWIRRLMAQGVLPNLESVLSSGKWMEVESSAQIGSGSVWPTFITGSAPNDHGVYGEWEWQPETMNVRRYSGGKLVPFWGELVERGATVGVLDVPFMPLVGLSDGFEISEWGPHDVFEGRTEVGPLNVKSIVEKHGQHPAAFGAPISGPDDQRNLEKVAQASLVGAQLRGSLACELVKETKPDLTLIVFPETHRCGHYFWNTTDPDHGVYRESGIKIAPNAETVLVDLYREVDHQIGEILKTANNDSIAVVVFSLHGMQPAYGIPAFLGPLLNEAGFSRIAGWESQAWGDRLRTLSAHTKRRLPGWAKKLYYSVMPTTTTQLVARSTMLPQYDWKATRAFALPTDQHGWIRINLIGREAKGVVALDKYFDTCDEVESFVRGLVSEDGRPLVRNVVRTVNKGDDPISLRIPDIVVHWNDVAFSPNLRIKDSAVRVENGGKKFVAQHSLRGFCVVNEVFDVSDQEILQGKDLHRLIIRAMEGKAARTASGPK